jgi:LmbE family N-acetylglucosaminyl deacetylase
VEHLRRVREVDGAVRAQARQERGRVLSDRAHTIVFFHAHPDDEAIFTGGTMARLAALGHRVVVVMATSGDLGVAHEALGAPLADVRERELHEACRLLGVDEVVLLRYDDSGIDHPVMPDNAFAHADVETAATLVAEVLVRVQADAVVFYDEGGIYGHADHVQVHRVGLRAAELAGTPRRYEATVDREYLHFVDTHLIDHAREALPHIEHIGMPTVFISAMVDVCDHLAAKRAAIAAHASQVHETSSVMQLSPDSFRSVYGFEWYVRHGPPGVLDALATW